MSAAETLRGWHLDQAAEHAARAEALMVEADDLIAPHQIGHQLDARAIVSALNALTQATLAQTLVIARKS